MRARQAVKVPAIGALFWLIKVLTTGMGEAASDFLATRSLVLAGLVGVLGITAGLWLQFRTPRYVPAVYWFAVAMVAVFGTMAADGLHVALGVPYAISTLFWAIVVGVLFWRWHRVEGTLSIHSITTRRRETFYWLTVLATFALGTAAGDLTAASLHLGYLVSGILFAVVIAVPALAWWRFGLNATVAFWAAYVVTRPLGASFADWFAKPRSGKSSGAAHGLGYGDGTVTVLLTLAIAALVAYLALNQGGTRREAELATAGG